jgi:type II secretory pathway pseudopilin PulG
MHRKSDQSGFGAVETLLVLVIIGILVGITLFMLHGKQQIDARAKSTQQIAAATIPAAKTKAPTVTSKQPAKSYMVIKEWGVRVPLTNPGAYYIDSSDSNLTVYSTMADATIGPKGVSCKGEYIAYLMRLPIEDSAWNGSETYLFSTRKTIGSYTYALSTKKEYGPECFNKGTDNNYVADDATAAKFGTVVTQFKTDFLTLQADTE